MTTPIPISEALEKYDDPGLKEFVNKIQNGDINFCACMGKMYDEPYCICEMQRRGLALNEAARAKDRERFETEISKWINESRKTNK